jgi:hypothetical protein
LLLSIDVNAIHFCISISYLHFKINNRWNVSRLFLILLLFDNKNNENNEDNEDNEDNENNEDNDDNDNEDGDNEDNDNENEDRRSK